MWATRGCGLGLRAAETSTILVANPAINTPMAMPLTIFSERDIRVSVASCERAVGSIPVERGPGAVANLQAKPILDEAVNRAFTLMLIRSSSTLSVWSVLTLGR